MRHANIEIGTTSFLPPPGSLRPSLSMFSLFMSLQRIDCFLQTQHNKMIISLRFNPPVFLMAFNHAAMVWATILYTSFTGQLARLHFPFGSSQRAR